MSKQFISLHSIALRATVDNKLASGTLVYGFLKRPFVDNHIYEDFIDDAILCSITHVYSDAEVRVNNMLDNSSWVKFYSLFSRKPITLNAIPDLSTKDESLISVIAPNILFPNFPIEIYPSVSAYRDAPFYPFDMLSLKYKIGTKEDDLKFIEKLLEYRKQYFLQYSHVEQSLKFNNICHKAVYDNFILQFGKRVSAQWPQINNLVIDVYDEEHLKHFATSRFMPSKFWSDTPFSSFPFRLTEKGIIEHDIIENKALCELLQLSEGEIYSLLLHELGHFDFKARGITQFQSLLDEEISCDEYAVDLSMGGYLASSLDKLISANVCSAQQNHDMQQRIANIEKQIL